MVWADVLIVLICVASGAFGYWRGLAKEALSLATWLAAIWLAWRFTWLIEPWLGEWLAQPELKLWTARVILFVVVLIAGGVAAWFARTLVRATGLSGTDRTLGGLFGVARGVLIVGLLVIGMGFAGVDEEPWWQRARLKPVADSVAAGIVYYAELGTRYIEEQELVEGVEPGGR